MTHTKTAVIYCLLLGFISVFIPSLVFANESTATTVSNKLSARQTTPVVTFYNSSNEGVELTINEGSFQSAIGIALSESPETDITFSLFIDPIGSTATQPQDFIIPDPQNSGNPVQSIGITIPAGTAAGQTEIKFVIDITDNNIYEGGDDKEIVLLINNIVGGIVPNDQKLVIKIEDDEIKPVIHVDTANTTIFEEIHPSIAIDLKMLRSVSRNDISLKYNLQNSEGMFLEGTSSEADYRLPIEASSATEIIIPAQSLEFTINIPFINDVIAENQEQLTFTISSGNSDNYVVDDVNNQVVITVIDGDSNQNKITDTGVTKCYDGVTNTSDCFVNPNFPQQDGSSQTARNFVKIDSVGTRMNDSVNTHSCVYDADTGLLWEIKAPTTDPDLFSWFNSATTVNGGDEGNEGGTTNCDIGAPCDTENYVNHLNILNGIGLCGVRKWRMPSVFETISILDFETDDIFLAIDTHYFPNTATSTYWTTTPASVKKEEAWCVDFRKRSDNNIPHVNHCPKTLNTNVRLVATCKLGLERIEC